MKQNNKLIIALGSNTNQMRCMNEAETKLKTLFGDNVTFSEHTWTKPIGMDSPLFLNTLAIIDTKHNLTQIKRALRHIEHSVGGSKMARKRNIVRMDIDILQYGEDRYHEEDWERDYIQKLLGEFPDDADL